MGCCEERGHRLQDLEGEIRRKRGWRADAVRWKVWGWGEARSPGRPLDGHAERLCPSPVSRVQLPSGPGFTFECVPGTSFRLCGRLRESEPRSQSRPHLWSSWLRPRAGHTLGDGTGTGHSFGCLARALGWGAGSAPLIGDGGRRDRCAVGEVSCCPARSHGDWPEDAPPSTCPCARCRGPSPQAPRNGPAPTNRPQWPRCWAMSTEGACTGGRNKQKTK